MRTSLELTVHALEHAYEVMRRNVDNVTADEALFAPRDGYRSIIGTLKHAAGWSRVYRSYAFDAEPRHWERIDWPRGLHDTIVKSEKYWHEVVA